MIIWLANFADMGTLRVLSPGENALILRNAYGPDGFTDVAIVVVVPGRVSRISRIQQVGGIVGLVRAERARPIEGPGAPVARVPGRLLNAAAGGGQEDGIAIRPGYQLTF